MKRLLARDDSVPVPWTKGLGKELLSAENPVARRFEALVARGKGGRGVDGSTVEARRGSVRSTRRGVGWGRRGSCAGLA